MTNKLYYLNVLSKYLSATTEELKDLFKFNELNYGFIDNDAKVLGVVHLDTVLVKPQAVTISTTSSGDTYINHINLDDRLGLWILLDVLPQLGIKFDVLLTDNEEMGQSTAMEFTTQKKYNWMFQFDRRRYGCAVMYQYDDRAISDILEEYGFDVQIGTFSDICYLDHLGCVGINFGCGYIDEHTQRCMSRLSWVDTSVKMFCEFYKDFYDIAMPYTYTPKKYPKYNYIQPKTSVDTAGASFCDTCGRVLLSHEVPYMQCDFCYENSFSIPDDFDDEYEPKKEQAIQQVKCKLCQGEFAEEDLFSGYCVDCLDSMEDDAKGDD